MKLKIKYNHPSIPPKGIILDRVYRVEIENKNKIIVGDLEFKLKTLKTLFIPLQGKWEDVFKTEEKKIKKVKENTENKG